MRWATGINAERPSAMNNVARIGLHLASVDKGSYRHAGVANLSSSVTKVSRIPSDEILELVRIPPASYTIVQ
jgi:hypothetical protein